MSEGEVASRAIEQFRREFPELDVRFYQSRRDFAR